MPPRDEPNDSLRDRYERALRALLWRTRPSDLQRRVEQRLHDADALQRNGVAEHDALARTYSAARAEVVAQVQQQWGGRGDDEPATLSARQRLRHREQLLDEGVPKTPHLDAPDFHCDAGLGGLARWLRAAGYDARWWPGIDDDLLLQKVFDDGALLLTNDRRFAERGSIALGVVAGLLVPITLDRRGQLRRVVATLELPIKRPRCTKCGGRLTAIEKTTIRQRIPPRTYPWCDDYFVCDRCDHLFWRGTHWKRIEDALASAHPVR